VKFSRLVLLLVLQTAARLRGFAVKFSRIFINFTRPASQTTDFWDLAA
jgi:hypothetical protein